MEEKMPEFSSHQAEIRCFNQGPGLNENMSVVVVGKVVTWSETGISESNRRADCWGDATDKGLNVVLLQLM
jgi:hypothetical protein